MKKIILSLLLFFAMTVWGQQPTVSPEQKMLPHPRLLWLKAEEPALKEAISRSVFLTKIHQNIIDESDRMISLPVLERNQVGRRILHTSRELLRRVFYLSYSWRMTGEDKYAQRAEFEMMNVCTFKEWNPSHFLDVAEMVTGLSIGYDWLYPVLSDRSKDVIKASIIAKGLEPSYRPHGWLTGTNNWNQVCNGGMTYGAIAVFEDFPFLAAKVINRSVESLKIPMRTYNPDGVYPEGYGYWQYGTEYNLLMLDALEKALGITYSPEELSGFMQTGAYIQHMITPTGTCYNYGDNGRQGNVKAGSFWFANKNKDTSLVWSDMQIVKNRPDRKYTGDRLLPALLIWNGLNDPEKTTPPDQLIWTGHGENPVSLMRTSWNDPTALFVGVKGGKPTVSHGHMDVGSFIMEADGVRWAHDLGPEDYHSIEKTGADLWNMREGSDRWKLFRYNNYAHNTLVVNDSYQSVDGYAPIEKDGDSPGFLFSVVNMDKVYPAHLKESRRGIAIVDKKSVLVRDEVVASGQQATLRWHMMTDADIKIINDQTAILTKDDKQLTIKGEATGKLKIKQWSANPGNEVESANKGFNLIGFEIEIAPGEKELLNVWLLPGKAKANKKTGKKMLADW